MRDYRSAVILMLLGALVWQGMATVQAQETPAPALPEGRACRYTTVSQNFQVNEGWELMDYSPVAVVTTGFGTNVHSTTRHYVVLCEVQ